MNVLLFLAAVSGFVVDADCGDGKFTRGDFFGDGKVDTADVTNLLSYLFVGGAPPCEWDAADYNDDGAIDNSDVVYLQSYLFTGGAEPPPPFFTGELGIDTTPDYLFNEQSPPPTDLEQVDHVAGKYVAWSPTDWNWFVNLEECTEGVLFQEWEPETLSEGGSRDEIGTLTVGFAEGCDVEDIACEYSLKALAYIEGDKIEGWNPSGESHHLQVNVYTTPVFEWGDECPEPVDCGDWNQADASIDNHQLGLDLYCSDNGDFYDELARNGSGWFAPSRDHIEDSAPCDRDPIFDPFGGSEVHYFEEELNDDTYDPAPDVWLQLGEIRLAPVHLRFSRFTNTSVGGRSEDIPESLTVKFKVRLEVLYIWDLYY